MTDARFPERWLNDRRIMKLSAVDFRAFMLALAWSVSNRTDGRLEPADLPLIPGFDPDSVNALVSSGLWSAVPGGWQVTDFLDTQTTSAQLKGLDHKRVMDKHRQARKRAHDDGDHSLCLPDNCAGAPGPQRDSPHDVTRDGMRDTKDRTGQARTGQALEEEISEAERFSSKDPELSSTDPDFCEGCGVEMDTWRRGPVPGRCLDCSGPGSAVSDPAVLAVGPDTCSVPGCSGVVTDYLRREYGPVCYAHAGAVAS